METIFKLSSGYKMNFREISRIGQKILNWNGEPTRINIADKLGLSPARISRLWLMMSALALGVKGALRLTSFGKLIFSFDPFIDKEETLWLLHYTISSNPRILVWHRIVNFVVPFEDKLSTKSIKPYFKDLEGHYSKASLGKYLNKEIITVIDTYTQQAFKKIEYLIISKEGKVEANKNHLVPDICILAALYLYLDKFYKGSTSIETEDLIKKPNSPGRVFNIQEEKFCLSLERLHAQRHISIESRANLDQIRFNSNKNWLDIVNLFYEG